MRRDLDLLLIFPESEWVRLGGDHRMSSCPTSLPKQITQDWVQRLLRTSRVLLIDSIGCTLLVPPGMLVGCFVLSGQWAFIHSSFASTRTSSLRFLDYAFVQ